MPVVQEIEKGATQMARKINCDHHKEVELPPNNKDINEYV